MDADLLSIQEARDAVAAAGRAARELASFDQTATDCVVAAMAAAARDAARRLAAMAVEETGFGVFEHKVKKNLFAAQTVYDYIAPLATCGVIREDDGNGVVEIAAPVGVIAAVVPVTNPTSTTIFKALIALKARNAVVFSPHPAAVRCTAETARVLGEAATSAGAPASSIVCLQHPTLEAARELMAAPGVALILATGGLAMVRAAYSSGKPAYGVGPGNVPVYVDRSADAAAAAAAIIASKCFDNGVICASEQAVVCDAPIREDLISAFKRAGCVFLTASQKDAVARVLDGGGRVNPAVVGQPAARVAALAGFDVPPETPILIGFEDRVGPAVPFSWEKMCPVLAWYDVPAWEEGCERSIEILANGGLGHTLAIHARDERVVREFGLRKPVSRVVVNTPSSQAAVGMTTALPPSLTLGCGTLGGNITSDNITPLHLVHIRRIAYHREDNKAPTRAEVCRREADPDPLLVKRVVAEVLKQLGRR